MRKTSESSPHTSNGADDGWRLMVGKSSQAKSGGLDLI